LIFPVFFFQGLCFEYNLIQAGVFYIPFFVAVEKLNIVSAKLTNYFQPLANNSILEKYVL